MRISKIFIIHIMEGKNRRMAVAVIKSMKKQEDEEKKGRDSHRAH